MAHVGMTPAGMTAHLVVEMLHSTRKRRTLVGMDWLSWPPPTRKIKHEILLFSESTLETNISALREAQHRDDVDTLRMEVRDLWKVHHDIAALLQCHPHGNWMVILRVTDGCLPDPVDEIKIYQALSALSSVTYLRFSGMAKSNEQDVLLRNLPRFSAQQELDLGDLFLDQQSLIELDKLPCIHNIQCLSFHAKGAVSESHVIPNCVAMTPHLCLTLTDTTPAGIAQFSKDLEGFSSLVHLTVVFQWGDVLGQKPSSEAFADIADCIASPACRLQELTLSLVDSELYPVVLDGLRYNSSLRRLGLDTIASRDLRKVLPLVQSSNIGRVDLAYYFTFGGTVEMLLDWQLRLRPCLIVVSIIGVLHGDEGFAVHVISKIHSKLAHFRELQDPLLPSVWPTLLVGMNVPTDSIHVVHVVSVDAVFEVLTRCLSAVATIPVGRTAKRM